MTHPLAVRYHAAVLLVKEREAVQAWQWNCVEVGWWRATECLLEDWAEEIDRLECYHLDHYPR